MLSVCRVGTLVLSALALLLIALEAEGQITGCPSYISITQHPASPYYQSTANITVEYGDLVADPPMCLSYGNTHDPDTFRFYVNGVNRTSYFNVGTSSAVGTNVPLDNEETNVFLAQITGWDEDNIPRTDSDGENTDVDTTPFPSVSLDFNTFDNQDLGVCATSCFAATYAQSTVPYFTLGQPRSVSLYYHGDRLAPHPFVYVDVDVPYGAQVPQQFWLEVQRSGSPLTFTNGDTRLYFAGDSQRVRLAGQLRMNSDTSGVYPVQVIVGTVYSGPDLEQVNTAVGLMVVSERKSPVARGWAIGGLQRLFVHGDTIAMITEGDGSALYFKRTCGDPCAYTTPAGEYSKLTASGSGAARTYTRVYTDSSRAVFNHLGRLTKVVRLPMDTVEFGYDGSGRLTKIYDPFRRYSGGANKSYIELTYGTHGLQSIRDPGPDGSPTGGRTTYVSVTDSALRTIKDPDGDSTRFTYDDSLRLNGVVDRRGSTTTYAYDNRSWKLASITLPSIPIDAGGGSSTNASPVTTLAAWQAVGVPTSATSSLAPAIALRNADTVTASVMDAEGRAMSYTANRWGLPLKATDPLGRVTTAYRVSGAGMFADSVKSYTGAVDRFVYSGQFLIGETLEGKAKVNYRYGGWGLVDSTWGTGYASKRYGLSGGRITWERTAGRDSLTTSFAYDSRGRLSTLTKPRGQVTIYHYDATFGNLDSTLAPANRFTRTRFDSKGRDSLAQSNGMPWNLVLYDVINRITEVHDSVGVAVATRYTYDAVYLTDVRDQLGQRYRFDRNAFGWMTKIYDPADTTTWSRYTSYRYNKLGLVTSRTNRRNQRIDQTYDILNRVRSRSIGGVPRDSFAYDSLDRYGVAWNGVARDSFFLAKSGWVDSVVTRYAGATNRFRIFRKPTTTLELDSMHIKADSGITFVARKHVYDAGTRALHQIKLDGAASQFSRNRDLDIVETDWPSISNTRTDLLTVRGRPYDQSYASGNLTLWRGLGLDSLGRVINYLTKDGAEGGHRIIRHFYDPLGRLSGEEYGAFYALNHCAEPDSIRGYACEAATLSDSTVSYTYDLVGNRTDASDELYLVGNRLIRFQGDTFTYDLDGNVTRKRNTYYYWSADGLLDSVVAGMVTLRYEYDAAGRLVRTTRNGAINRYFLWDGAQLLAELSHAAQQRVGEYVYLPGLDKPMALITGATTVVQKYHLVLDQIGNVIGAVNDTSYAIKYNPWGTQTEVTGSLASTNRLTWKGLLWEGDSTKLYYVRNRWYDPDVGRFSSEDPIGLAGGITMYAFGHGDPINRADPSGLCEIRKYDENGKYQGTRHVGSDEEKCKGGGFAVKCAGDEEKVETCVDDETINTIKENPGAWIGTTGILSVPGFWVRHSAVATSKDGKINVIELAGWTDHFFNEVSVSNSEPLYGDFGEYRWARIAGEDQIGNIHDSANRQYAQFDGRVYTGGSNRFVSAVVGGAGLAVPHAAWQGLGWTPGMCMYAYCARRR